MTCEKAASIHEMDLWNDGDVQIGLRAVVHYWYESTIGEVFLVWYVKLEATSRMLAAELNGIRTVRPRSLAAHGMKAT